jgi:iron-containing alcohol dehydrogenase-like protein
MSEAFRHVDRDQTIVFGADAFDAAADLIRDGFTLLTTARAAGSAMGLTQRAGAVVHVPSGPVDVVAAQIRSDVAGQMLVALGGGRVIDVAKALAAADGPRDVVAVPTSLSGAEMTGVHRHARGVADSTARVRASVVVNDPALTASPSVRCSPAGPWTAADWGPITRLRRAWCAWPRSSTLTSTRCCCRSRWRRCVLATAAGSSGWTLRSGGRSRRWPRTSAGAPR